MRSVFVDTSGFYAALNRKDAAHREARQLFRQAREERWFLFTTNFIIAETHALILIRRGRDRAWQFLGSLYAGRTNVIRVEEEGMSGKRGTLLKHIRLRTLVIVTRSVLQ